MSEQKERILRRRRKRRLTNSLVAGLAILAVSAAGLALIGAKPDEETPVMTIGKSKGEANAPVVVEEYGDFQ